MERMSGRDYIGWIGITLFLTGLNTSEVMRDVMQDYEKKEECGIYSALGTDSLRGGRRVRFVEFMMDEIKVKYRFSSKSLYEKIVEENPSIDSIICLTTYENTYYQLNDGRVLILQASIDGEVIHQNERESDTFSLFIMGLGAIISVIYWLFIRRK